MRWCPEAEANCFQQHRKPSKSAGTGHGQGSAASFVPHSKPVHCWHAWKTLLQVTRISLKRIPNLWAVENTSGGKYFSSVVQRSNSAPAPRGATEPDSRVK